MSSGHCLNDETPLFADYLNSAFPCDDLFFNDKSSFSDQSPLLRSYSQDNGIPSSPESNHSTSSKSSSNGVDSDISLAILRNTYPSNVRSTSPIKTASLQQSPEETPASATERHASRSPVRSDIKNAASVPLAASTPPSPTKYQLNLHGIPTKSRVETQIRLGLQLVCITNEETEVREKQIGDRFQWVKLPAWAMAKEKLKLQNRRDAPATIDPTKIIFLDARVVKSTDPLEDVTICPGCVIRERKRAQRKKDSPKRDASDATAEVCNKSPTNELLPLPDEEKKILVFNCPELLGMSNGEVTIPTRVTCYCRHHKEKDGFRIIITLRDASNNILASTSSELVLITDDHKTTGKVYKAKDQPIVPVKGLPYSAPSTGTTLSADLTSKLPLNSNTIIPSPSKKNSAPSRSPSTSASISRKRKAPSAITVQPETCQNKIQRVPSSLSMTNMGGQRKVLTTTSMSADTSRAPSPTSSQHHKRSPSQDSLMLFMREAHHLNSPISSGVRQTTNTSNSISSPDANFFDSTMEDMMHDQNSSHSPRSRTWDYIMDTSLQAQPAQYVQAGPRSSAIMPPILSSQAYAQVPMISRMVPSEGPLQGGVEVTMLGSGFRPGMTAMFGDHPAVPTHCWSATTLVCVLPPATNAGPVPVTFKEYPYHTGAKLFTYIDQTDRALYELALQVIGLKTTGRLETARDVAMRICSSKMPSESADVNFNSIPISQLRIALALPQTGDCSPEDLVLQCLRYSDTIKSDRPIRLSLRSLSGHTMLHLGSIQGYSRLVRDLLDRGANVNIRDRASLTPLHTAALHGRRDIAEQLITVGHASITSCTSLGKTAYDLASFLDDPDLLEILDPWVRSYYPAGSISSGRSSRKNSTSSFSIVSDSFDGASLLSPSELNLAHLDLSDYVNRSRSTLLHKPRSCTASEPTSRDQSPPGRSQSHIAIKSTRSSRAVASLELDDREDTQNEDLQVSRKKSCEVDANLSDAQNMAANFLQLQQSWLAFLAETSPTWLRDTIANANASLPEVFKAPSALSHHIQLPVSPISAFQAMLPQLPQLRSLSRSQSHTHGHVANSSGPSAPDMNWLQSLVASLGAPPSYAEATCDVPTDEVLHVSPSLGTGATARRRWISADHLAPTERSSNNISTAETDDEAGELPSSAGHNYFWRSPLRSQGRVAELTPEQQRAQVRKLQKPADPRLYCLWLPCLVLFMLISIGKAFLNKLVGLVC